MARNALCVIRQAIGGTEAGGRQGQLVVHDAVWVTGIDNTDPANPMVVLNDSGHPDGTRRR